MVTYYRDVLFKLNRAMSIQYTTICGVSFLRQVLEGKSLGNFCFPLLLHLCNDKSAEFACKVGRASEMHGDRASKKQCMEFL